MEEFIHENNKKLIQLKFVSRQHETSPAAQSTAHTKQVDNDQIDKIVVELASMNKISQKQSQHLLSRAKESSDESSVRLPKLELLTFNGDILKFKEFRDMSSATVHENKALLDVEKLSYLCAHLSGTALECISGLALINSNYTAAWNLIEKRFGKDRVITNARYLTLVELGTPTPQSESLRKFLNEGENNGQSLSALGEDISQALLIPLISSKLPRLVLVQLEMKRGGKAEWSIQTLRDALTGYVGALEEAEWATGDRHNEVSGTRSVPTHSNASPTNVQIFLLQSATLLR